MIHPENVFTQTIDAEWLEKKNIAMDVLRLDTLHEVVSGNKWFKLKYYLKDAKEKGFETIATFGGAFSNHIVATAFASYTEGTKSIGVIRGEEPVILSHTLRCARQYGMQLEFVTRSLFRQTDIVKDAFKNVYWIDEGGYGGFGIEGAKEILTLCKQPEKYTHIVCAVGTGTMLAGLVDSANAEQKLIGISVMKGNHALAQKVRTLISNKQRLYTIHHDYHFGGYAKHPPELIRFMNDTWQQHALPTDIVYTSKTFYAVQQMVLNNAIPSNSNILMIHSGGLQGNLSLPEKTLQF